jgi:hypothetical protein
LIGLALELAQGKNNKEEPSLFVNKQGRFFFVVCVVW